MTYLNGSKHRHLTSWCLKNNLSINVSRPEHADYNTELLWVKAQMEHARGATQAQQVSEATSPKWDRDGDVNLCAVLLVASIRSANAQEPSLLWQMAPPRRMCEACRWWRLGRRQFSEWRDHGPGKKAKAKTKEKGTAKGFSKAKRMSPKSAGKGGDWFDGTCYHFGAYSHWKAQCKHLDVEICGIGFQVADIERPLIAASQLAAAGIRVTFKAQGGEIDHIKTGRTTMLVGRGIHVLRMWVAANDPGFPGPGKEATRLPTFCAL